MKYKVIFVNWTAPFFKKNKNKKYSIPDYELLINKVAILNAKKYLQVTVKLYTDSVGYEYYKQNKLIELFDEVDIDVLNEYNENTLEAGKWWTSGKSIVIGKEEPPFLFLDNDFIVRSNLPETIHKYDLVHTHWELHRGNYYVSEKTLAEYKVPISNFNERMLMPNTSFVYLSNKDLQKKYLDNHLKVVEQQYKDIPEWLWLLSDQGILGYCARELNMKVGCLEKKAYLAYSEQQVLWLKDVEKPCGFTPMWVGIDGIVSTIKINYWHIWLDKHLMAINTTFRSTITEELNKILKLHENKILL
jgi:hypothetical protein